MTLTDWLLLGWTAIALVWGGAHLAGHLALNYERACYEARTYDRLADHQTDPAEARRWARVAEYWRRQAIWPCATESVR